MTLDELKDKIKKLEYLRGERKDILLTLGAIRTPAPGVDPAMDKVHGVIAGVTGKMTRQDAVKFIDAAQMELQVEIETIANEIGVDVSDCIP